MAFIFSKGRESLGKMDVRSLMIEERKAESRRRILERKATKLANDKQDIFDKGAKETSPELRRTLAQRFDLNTTEQLMIGRQLNIATKELMIVARVRAVKQNSGIAATVQPQDLKGIETAMDRDAAVAADYQEILDDALGATQLDEGELGLSEAGKDVMAAWEGLDTGTIPDAETALAEADKHTRERMSTAGE